LDKSVINRAVTLAGGRFAPGHLGELTQQVPLEMAGAVLEQTCQVQRCVRALPARVVVCLLLAGCLFAELGYAQVWGRLAAGSAGWASPSRPRPRCLRHGAGSGPGRCASCSSCCTARGGSPGTIQLGGSCAGILVA
jgi:hypothetical protein